MKFYIFSFILHLVFIFCIVNFSNKNFRLKSKNVVVYLSELEIEGKGKPAPLKNLKKEEKKPLETIQEKKQITNIKKDIKVTNDKNLKDKKNTKEIKNKNINPLKGLVKDGQGTYIGDEKLSQGIGYKILREVDPNYPEMAKKIGFKNEIKIETKFLVGLDGRVEKIIFLDSFTKYGFHKEVEKALKEWRFEPIIYQGKKIKMYFYKDFRFNIKRFRKKT